MKTHLGTLQAITLTVVLTVGCGGSSAPTGPSAAGSSSPAELFNLTGLVRDPLQRPIRDARVEVVDGPSAGRFTMTGVQGRFALDGVSPATDGVTLSVSKDRYTTMMPRVRKSGEVVVYLVDVSFADLEGRRVITFIADVSCTQLPPTVRARAYQAVITQSVAGPASMGGPSTWVGALSGGDFQPGYGTMWLTMTHDAARLNVFSWDAFNSWLEDDPIIDRVTATSHLSLSGTALADVANGQSTITTAFDGTFSFCAESKPAAQSYWPMTCAVPPVECKSAAHQITMTRR